MFADAGLGVINLSEAPDEKWPLLAQSPPRKPTCARRCLRCIPILLFVLVLAAIFGVLFIFDIVPNLIHYHHQNNSVARLVTARLLRCSRPRDPPPYLRAVSRPAPRGRPP